MIYFVRDDTSTERIITKRLFALAHTKIRRLGDRPKHLYVDGSELYDESYIGDKHFQIEYMAVALGLVERDPDWERYVGYGDAPPARDWCKSGNFKHITLIDRKPIDTPNYFFIIEGENNIVIGLY